MRKRKIEGSPLIGSEVYQGGHSIADEIIQEPIKVGIASTMLTEALRGEGNSSSEECFSPRGTTLGSQVEGPTGRLEAEGVEPTPGLPHVAAVGTDTVEDIHPFWRLLELAEYHLW